MKLRSLFLASLAAMAMVSCNNEVEGVDNNVDNVERNAKLQFSIGFPQTRATLEEGTTQENNIQTINVRVDYSEAISDDVFNFVLEDFTQNGDSYVLKPEKLMEVAPTTKATLYVTVNGDLQVTTNGTTTGAYDATTASIITGLAEDNNFLMSGKEDNVIITANSAENKATVKVDRVAVRIDEVSENKTTEFTFETDYRNLEGNVYKTEKQKMTAEIIDYALYNLNKATNIFKLENFATPDFFQPLTFDAKNQFPYNEYVNKEIGNTKTYCLENNSEDSPTAVIYQVRYKYENEENTTGQFFTYAKEIDGVKTTVLYKDFASLDADNDNRFSLAWNLNADSTYDEFIAAGVTKYEDGIAYYMENITTGGEIKVLRNNVYKLNVTKIGSLGKAVLDPQEPGEPTLLELTVTVNQWTVNTQDIEL